MSDDWQQLRTTLKKIWGYEDFRAPQGEIIRTLLAHRDALIIMPTGGGKSICFQLPALLQTGLTVVVSPLVALMENQVQELNQRQIPAALVHSELPKSRRKVTLNAISQGKLKLLYLSPETLLSPVVWQILCQPQLEINSLILDEAHCLVQWGDTFRPAYRRLGALRPALLKFKPPGSKIAVAAFTATADIQTQQMIQQALQLRQPETFILSPYRPNLHLQVQVVWTPRGKRQRMLRFIQAREKEIGLVYVRSRRESEKLAQWFRDLGYQCAAYHGGLSATQRRNIEHGWLSGKLLFVVCTCAFGMGINQPHCRWILHFQAPQLLSEYVQEVGRGGRDGKPATALALVSESTGWFNPEDKQRQQFFTDKLEQQYQKAQQLARKLPRKGEIDKFPNSELTLALLHSAGQLIWQDPFHFRQTSGNLAVAIKQLRQRQQHSQSQSQKYLRTRQCRWQFLLTAFGFSQQAEGFSCGHCDNCCRNR